MRILQPNLFLNPALPSNRGDTGTTAPGQAGGAEPEAEKEGEGGGGFSFMPFIIIGVIFWFLLIGPERKNRKKQEQMRADLGKGDEVMTTGGMFGRIVAVDEDKITLQVADGVRVKFVRQSIQGRVSDLEEAQNAKKGGGKASGKDSGKDSDKDSGKYSDKDSGEGRTKDASKGED